MFLYLDLTSNISDIGIPNKPGRYPPRPVIAVLKMYASKTFSSGLSS